jgi:hypothetical protein
MPRGRFRESLTHCIKGHELTEENTYRNPSFPNIKVCRICSEKSRTQWKKDHPKYWIAHQKKRHGLSEERYETLIEKQNSCCAICKRPFIPGEPPRIDHNHECCPGAYSCGECVRGLLCANCNFGLGSFKDNETNLRNALEYLADPPASEK